MSDFSLSGLPVVNVGQIEDLRNLDGGAGEFLASVVQVYLKLTSDRVAEIKVLATAQEFAKISAIAHSLKGASGSLGAIRVAEVSRGLELACEESDGAALEPLVAALEHEFANARTVLQTHLK